MFKVLGVLAAGCAVLATAAPARADLTPDGRASIFPTAMVPCPWVAGPPTVTTAWRVTVGEGGRAGGVWPVFDHYGSRVIGDRVELPATPGTYTFHAPHQHFDICADPVAIVQETGGHAIMTPGEAHQWIDIKRDGQADERLERAALAISIVTERDVDVDLVGDLTEDRTDLRVRAGSAAVTLTTRGLVGRTSRC